MKIEAGEILEMEKENGDVAEYEVLYTFIDEATDKEYMVLAEINPSPDAEVEITAVRYVMDGEEISLFPLETDEEWNFVDDTFKEYMEQLRDSEF